VLGRHLVIPDHGNLFLRTWHRGGWVGVDLFFVLSGFLVSSLLFREHKKYGSVDIKRFLIRRGLKIYPPLWFFVALVVMIRVVLGNRPSGRAILSELLFVQNYVGGIWGHTWSLAVEEHFYLGIAALFALWAWLKPRHDFSALPRMFALVALLCLGLRLITVMVHPQYDFWHYYCGTQNRIDSLFFGVLIAYFSHFRQMERKLACVPSWVFLAAGGLLLSPAFLVEQDGSQWMATFGVMLFYVGSGLILIAALRFPESTSRPLQFLGRLGGASYSIYLWHMPVSFWGWMIVRNITGSENYLLYLVTYLGGSCLVGWGMSRLVEFPVLRLRDLLFPSSIHVTAQKREEPARSRAEPFEAVVQNQTA
jgi:peptidoglycan/LPS O-acetylase OafA/YrhL